METLLIEIATGAARTLLHPAALAMPLLGVVLIASGLAARVALFVEDLRHAGDDRW